MAERQKEWQNGRNWIQNNTYVLFMVHTDTDDDDDDDNDDDDDDDDTLIIYNIDKPMIGPAAWEILQADRACGMGISQKSFVIFL